MLHTIPEDKFGEHRDEMAKAVSTCVHCGFCLAACPTYHELQQEPDSPRGRIVLMKEVLEGEMKLEQALPHIDPCLGCLACEPACPSGVPYRDLISPFRAIAESERQRPLMERFSRWMIRSTLPFPSRFRIAASLGRFAKPFSPLMPKSIRSMLSLLPPAIPRKQAWATVSPAKGPRRAKVALLTGCAQSVLDPDINTATIDVLTHNGVEVHVPANQTCCGALSWHVGQLKQAQNFAKSNLDAFPEDVDAIITNAAGCGSGMQEYHLILKGTPQESLAKLFQSKVVDVASFLAQLDSLEPIDELERSVKVAYHDACHLANAQNVRRQPRDLLRMIPGVEVLEIHDGHLCCGSAGTYNIDQPEIANSLGEQKAQNIIDTGADIVATGNIGCMTQLAIQLRELGSDIEVRHTMQLLRDAYRNKDLKLNGKS